MSKDRMAESTHIGCKLPCEYGGEGGRGGPSFSHDVCGTALLKGNKMGKSRTIIYNNLSEELNKQSSQMPTDIFFTRQPSTCKWRHSDRWNTFCKRNPTIDQSESFQFDTKYFFRAIGVVKQIKQPLNGTQCRLRTEMPSRKFNCPSKDANNVEKQKSNQFAI